MVNIQETNTIRNLLKWAVDTLKKSNIESADINADTLLVHVLKCEKIKLYANPDKIIKDENVSKYERLINKRARHIPLQYITGHVEFMSLDFVVDKRTLIPRQETEILVETVLDKSKNRIFSDKKITIIDLCVGCGNIAIALATNLQNAQVYASDTSKEALEIAITNVKRHNVIERVHLFHGNLFDAFDENIKKGNVDFIVSNPPYVRESEWNGLEPEIKDHEPREALVGGKDGLFFYKRIIRKAPEWLRPKGLLIMEIGETQANAVTKLVEREGHFENIEIIKDLQKKKRIVSARRK
ncbi:MAG: peptide chain release factor N(5)-glutamine methyltransferase [Candidatus Scalinduaceae bacterium]